MFLSFLILVLNVKPREVMLFGSKPLLRLRGVFSKPIEVAQSFCTKNEDPNFLVKAYIGEKIGNETFFESFVCRHFLCLAKCTNPHFDVYHEKMEILIQLQNVSPETITCSIFGNLRSVLGTLRGQRPYSKLPHFFR